MLSALSSKVLSTRESYSSRSQFLHGIWANDDYTPDPKGGTASVSNFYPIAKQFILLAPIVVLPDQKNLDFYLLAEKKWSVRSGQLSLESVIS